MRLTKVEKQSTEKQLIYLTNYNTYKTKKKGSLIKKIKTLYNKNIFVYVIPVCLKILI